jgi:hypothetical protein
MAPYLLQVDLQLQVDEISYSIARVISGYHVISIASVGGLSTYGATFLMDFNGLLFTTILIAAMNQVLSKP